MWEPIKNWFQSVGNEYGVDPLVFALIYLLTIPCFTVAVGWIVRRLLRGRSFVLPSILAALFYISSYAYIVAVGRNIPLWVYGLMVALIAVGGYFTIQNIRKRTARLRPHETTHDLIVIGGGAAGLTAAGIGTHLGARTLLIEREKLGGDCTWTGCVPSKTLLSSANVAHQMRHASRYGLSDHAPEVDFQKVMARLREKRQAVYEEADSPDRLEAMGVEVRHGDAHFIDEHTLEIEEEDGIHTVSGRYLIIACGGRPSSPPIDGLDEVPYLTTDTLFELEELPRHLAILGAGPVGTEMAQAFRRFGSEVTVLDQADRILQNDDPELAGMLLDRLQREGIIYLLGANVERVAEADDQIEITARVEGEHRTVMADTLLVATGRQPNLEELRLQAADVEHTEKGVTVSDRCRTSQRHIYAAGDITGRYQFTHMSAHMARVAAANLLLKMPLKIDKEYVPWVTYTDPELAHVGRTEAELQEEGASYEVYRFPYEKLDRAVTDEAATGLIKVFATKWRGKILGATILGTHAGDLICEYALAMKRGVTLRHIADTIHPYPTYGLGARRAADQWYIRKLTPRLVHLIKRIFGYRGEAVESDRIV